ncbi:hypothetical protein ABEY63_26415 [Priestia aryabhattai]|uniref:hypothetical protein n=1 Tax=Priestia aryabhattai TaxID=412384 RepID=UPI003D275B6C
MDASIVNNLITSGVTVGGGVITAVAAYKGTIEGSKLQIKSQQKATQEQIESDTATAIYQIKTEQENLDKAIAEQKEFNKRAIKNFINYEIKDNFFKFSSVSLEERLKNNSYPFQFGCNHEFSYHEYNQLKYELVKFESAEVEEIISIYNMFYLLERRQDIIAFTEEEYESFKQAFFICESKYV